MSRCKCGKRLTEAELKHRNPKTGEFLDYCFDCLDAVSEIVEEDIEELSLDVDSIEDSLSEGEFSSLMNEMEDFS